jgi:hypothetical protein
MREVIQLPWNGSLRIQGNSSGMARKERNEIPVEVAAKVLFLSDRVCCICRGYRKPVQIHHIDEDPSNGQEGNLAVLCFQCHRETQIRGGFDRKLDAHQIVLYRDDWYKTVDRQRHGPGAPEGPEPLGGDAIPGITEILIQKQRVHLSYLKLSEKDEEHRYSFDADYPQIAPEETTVATETNLGIAAFVTRELQRFRAQALSTSGYKAEMLGKSLMSAMSWDDMTMSHGVGLFTDSFLALEFRLWSYWAGAAHPNQQTKTLNFLLQNSLLLELDDLFVPETRYLDSLSKYCVTDLHAHQSPSLKSNSVGENDKWILRGAGPQYRNFEKFLLVKGGLRVFFDPYSVGSYAEGRREVFMPLSVLGGLLKESIARLLS